VSRAPLVVVNPRAHGGEGLARWKRVAHLVQGTIHEGECGAAVAGAIAGGCRDFVAAGGDGTLNGVLNAIVEAKGGRPLEEFTLGSVGLGSSNDFHKPFARVVSGIPLKIDAARCALHDVGEVQYGEGRRCFLVGAGFGTIAQGNALFNAGCGLLGWLKRRWTGGAIAYAAVRALQQHRNVQALLEAGTAKLHGFSNVAVIKRRYLCGALRFDTSVEPDDGLFAVNIVEPVGRLGLLWALGDLRRGRFAGRPGCMAVRAASVRIESDRTIAAEIDGEIVEGSRFEIRILPERIRVCG